MPTIDLPVVWWAFWLVVAGWGGFAAFAWWFRRSARDEDAASQARRSVDREESPEDRPDTDRSDSSP